MRIRRRAAAAGLVREFGEAESYHQHLGRGFNWLGGATLVAKIADFLVIFLVILFLTKQQLGVGSLVVSIGVVVEALDGFGSNEALVQAKSVSPLQLDTLFWFVIGAAILVGGITLAAAPWIGAAYGVPGMAMYLLAVAAKQPLVGAALIPLAIMNRELQYERIAVVNVSATLGAALTRLGLAVAGAGVWALVAGYAVSGLFILIGALLARPFLPRLRFQFSEIVPLLRFGIRASMSNVFQQMFKNVDYLLVGWFYGPSQLAVYRVAFDAAMEPANAVGTLVNRTALPVFARVSQGSAHVAQSLTWSLRRLVTLVAPLMAGLILIAGPLTNLLHDKQGHSYAAAATPLRLLALAALLRVMLELLYPLLIGSGRPGIAARLSAITLLLLGGGIFAVGRIVRPQIGLIAVSVIWLAIYPLLLIWAAGHLWRRYHIRAGDLARVFIVPSVGVAAMVCFVAGSRLIIGNVGLKAQIGVILAATALTYAGLLMHARYHPDQTA